jgi:hypothetical protein
MMIANGKRSKRSSACRLKKFSLTACVVCYRRGPPSAHHDHPTRPALGSRNALQPSFGAVYAAA